MIAATCAPGGVRFAAPPPGPSWSPRSAAAPRRRRSYAPSATPRRHAAGPPPRGAGPPLAAPPRRVRHPRGADKMGLMFWPRTDGHRDTPRRVVCRRFGRSGYWTAREAGCGGRAVDTVATRRGLRRGGCGGGPNWSSRRGSRGAKCRFGPFVGRACPLQRAAEDGTDPGAPWSYSGLRNSGIARVSGYERVTAVRGQLPQNIE